VVWQANTRLVTQRALVFLDIHVLEMFMYCCHCASVSFILLSRFPLACDRSDLWHFLLVSDHTTTRLNDTVLISQHILLQYLGTGTTIMRLSALIPAVLSAAALILSFLCLFAGSKQGFMEDYAIVTVSRFTHQQHPIPITRN
jgi:hypothetical protein